jgi:plasmid maintenance system killer protein
LFHVPEILIDGVDHQTVLEKVRAKVPGFPRERYEQALDEAQARVMSDLGRVRKRRSEIIQAARQEDVLNSVFTLHYFNWRYADHVGQYHLGKINIHETLRDLYPEAEIDAALARAHALIKDAMRPLEYDAAAGEVRWQELRNSHPGFSNQSVHKAMDYGYYVNK